MKLNLKSLLGLAALLLTAASLSAQDQAPPRPRPPQGQGQGQPPGRPGGPGGEGQRPMSPLIAALDANHDGEIDAAEIANASAALKTLDKNGDGKLTMQELRPPRPEGQGPRPGRPGGPEGDRPLPPPADKQ